jgi:TATA-box binding protein (TBP) (component of TFIID and TFIIIB)
MSILPYPSPSELSISTMTVVSNIKNNENLDEQIKLDLLSRIINICEDDDDILKTKEGGITKVDYYTNLDRKNVNVSTMKHVKKNPFFNQVSLVFKYFDCRSVNVKLFNNGKLQMTGIQSENESEYISKNIINILKQSKLKIYTSINDLYNENKESLINDYSLVYNNKTDKLSYYRWNYLNIIENIETVLDLKLFENNEMKTEFIKLNGWVSDYNITKFITILNNEFKSLNSKYLNVLSKYNELEKHNNTNNSIEQSKSSNVNHEMFKLSKILSYYKTTIPHLLNIIKKITRTQECDNELISYIMKKYRHELNELVDMDNISPFYEFSFIDNIENYKLQNIKIELINSDYTTNFMINNTKLNIIVKQEYKAFSSYEPNEYPGVKNKFFWNEKNINGNQGKCDCVPKCIERGKKSICTQITISVFQSGSVIITGAKSIQQIKDAYKYINDIFKYNYKDIYCKQQLKEGESQEKINNARKITRKKRLFYFKKEDLFENYKLIN